MLTEIYIKDFITISELRLRFQGNSTVFTGETGSGKSIFIEAIELVLGTRASSDTVRIGKDRADITLSFDIKHYPRVKTRLLELELHTEDTDCFLRRTITKDGKSKCYVNGIPATLQLMRELGDELFHLHSQHEQQILFKPDTQRRMLDDYAEANALVKHVAELHQSWQKEEALIRELTENHSAREQKSLFLQHQLTELEALRLSENEWTELEKNHKRHAEEMESMTELQEILALFQSEESPQLVSLLHDLRKKTEHLKLSESTSSTWKERIESMIREARDLESDIQHIVDQSEKNPELLETMEVRMGELFSASRKFKVQPSELHAFHHALKKEWESLQNSDEQLETLKKKQEKTLLDYRKEAQKLSALREKAGVRLSKQVNDTIHQLAMPHATFSIDCQADPEMISSHGFNKIQYMMQTQPNASKLPIAKALSGGELSRLSLALHLGLAHQTSIPTLIFDEVDTGIGGATAEKVGKLLRILGDSHQVFTITHQPQVAVQAKHHVLVEKTMDQEGAKTTLRNLSKPERVHEIARMLGGEVITDATRSHAEEIVNAMGH